MDEKPNPTDQDYAIDSACRSLVRLAMEANLQKKYGKTGIMLSITRGEITLIVEVTKFSELAK